MHVSKNSMGWIKFFLGGKLNRASMRLEYSSCHGQVSGDVAVIHAIGLAD